MTKEATIRGLKEMYIFNFLDLDETIRHNTILDNAIYYLNGGEEEDDE